LVTRERASDDRLRSLDGLRGFAILMVVWYHLWLVSGYASPLFGPLQLVARDGFLGVDLFFFISGFCIALPYARASVAARPLPRFRDFAMKRVRKIVPSYVLALVIFAFAFHERFGGPASFLAHFAAHAAFVHVFFPATFGSFSGPLWTLAVEVQFYAVFACFAPAIVRRPVVAYATLVGIATAYRLTIAALGIDDDFGWINQLPAVLDVFGAGVFGAFVYAGAVRIPRLPARVAAIVAATLVATAFVAVAAVADRGGDAAVHHWVNAWRFAFGPVLLVGTLGIVFGPARVRAFVAFGPLCALSVISYSAYLFNLEIVVALARTGLPGAAVFWLGAGATLAIAALVTYGFERPIQRGALGPRIVARRRSLGFGRSAGVAEGAG
jgi:peptidoglycan/LPS O-acetylase OafA/YrhL